MCTKWNKALNPSRLGTWTFYDPDLPNSESYRSYINGSHGDSQLDLHVLR